MPASDDLIQLRRWEDAGATWRPIHVRPGSAAIALCRCDGGEEVERLISSAPDLVAYALASQRLAELRAEIVADPENAWAARAGYQPLYVAHPAARIVVIGQAPGRRAQESGLAWNDASGATLFEWLGVSEETFRRPELFAVLPMDFYYPGKGGHGDLPPRRGFADRWHPPLLAQLADVRLTLLVGAYAQRHYLGSGSVTERVRGYRDHLPAVLPLVHPSPLTQRWRARNPWFVDELLPELRGRVAAVLAASDAH